jgi:hypothetical protein
MSLTSEPRICRISPYNNMPEEDENGEKPDPRKKMENGHYPKYSMIIEALQDLAVEQMHQ